MLKTQPRATYQRNRARAMQLLQQVQEPTEAHPYEAVFACELEVMYLNKIPPESGLSA